jgi:hypothetical protein
MVLRLPLSLEITPFWIISKMPMRCWTPWK